MELLTALRGKMQKRLEKNPNANVAAMIVDLRNAVGEVDALLAPSDDTARSLLTPLLTDPLNVGGKVFRSD